jgi:predicted amidophosphoribosyltransferase
LTARLEVAMMKTCVESGLDTEATYHLCPKCLRALPSGSQEHFCSNDGERLLTACPSCDRKITSPFARFCSGCGLEFRGSRAFVENRQ